MAMLTRSQLAAIVTKYHEQLLRIRADQQKLQEQLRNLSSEFEALQRELNELKLKQQPNYGKSIVAGKFYGKTIHLGGNLSGSIGKKFKIAYAHPSKKYYASYSAKKKRPSGTSSTGPKKFPDIGTESM